MQTQSIVNSNFYLGKIERRSFTICQINYREMQYLFLEKNLKKNKDTDAEYFAPVINALNPC